MKLNKIRDKAKKTEQLCWSCARACGRCSWSKYFIPIPNWQASLSYNATDKTISYEITSCPEYVFDKRLVTIEEVYRVTKIPRERIYKTPIKELQKYFINKGVLKPFEDAFILVAENVDRCVVCGEIIPEGTQICKNCQNRIDK